MAVNHTRALRVRMADRISLLPTWWDDEDNLVCKIPSGDVVTITDGGRAVNDLVTKLKEAGYYPFGCFNCRYFHQPGDMDDDDVTFGYCLQGKMGRNVQIGRDTTTKESSCDAHEAGDAKDQAITAREWSASLPRH